MLQIRQFLGYELKPGPVRPDLLPANEKTPAVWARVLRYGYIIYSLRLGLPGYLFFIIFLGGFSPSIFMCIIFFIFLNCSSVRIEWTSFIAFNISKC